MLGVSIFNVPIYAKNTVLYSTHAHSLILLYLDCYIVRKKRLNGPFTRFCTHQCYLHSGLIYSRTLIKDHLGK